MSFSLATAGCNLHCKYCQNWEISQSAPEDLQNYDLPPQNVVKEAIAHQCKSISFTYSDPIVFYEYSFDTAVIAKQQNILNVWVTAGFIEQKPLIDICPYLDAAHVDLKGMTEDYYKKMSDGSLKPVLDCITTMVKNNVWVEIINLVVPTWNDTDSDFHLLCRWIFDTLGPNVPLHFSRFWPTHQLKNLYPTPEETVNHAWETGKSIGLNYVYTGNISSHPGNHTYCPKCKNIVIERQGYAVLQYNLKNGFCTCGEKIPGIWDS